MKATSWGIDTYKRWRTKTVSLSKIAIQTAKIVNQVEKSNFLKTEEVTNKLEIFLGEDSTLFKNSHGDLLIESKDGLRQFRMDFNHPNPHKNPHTQLIEYEMKKKQEIRSY